MARKYQAEIIAKQRKAFAKKSERLHQQVERMNKTAKGGQWTVTSEARLNPSHLPDLQIVWIPSK